jgi:hypothetical protein
MAKSGGTYSLLNLHVPILLYQPGCRAFCVLDIVILLIMGGLSGAISPEGRSRQLS